MKFSGYKTFNVETVRQDTRACETVLHFNNAGASLQPDCVHQAVIEHLELERAIGGYEAFDRNLDKVQATPDALARMLNCQPAEIALTENATRAWDMAFYSIPFKPGDKILTSVAEYASNYLAYLHVGNRLGVTVSVVPNDGEGQLDVQALERMLKDPSVKLISLSHMPSQGGLVQPAAEIGKLARAHKVLFLLDACQSAGQMPLDVEALGCDMLSATGRKYLRGPRGTGFLYVRQSVLETLEPPFIDLHAATWTDPEHYILQPDARRFENWESYVAGRIGLGVAVNYALELGLDAIQNRVTFLADRLRQQLGALPGVKLTDLGRQKSGIVTFTKADENATALRDRLRALNIHTSVSPASYAQLDLPPRGETELVRASVHYYNTEEEIQRFCDSL